MVIGANTFIWTSPFGDADLPLIDKVKDMGFDLIEISIEDPDLIDVPRLQNALRRVEMPALTCGAFGPTRDLGNDDPAIRQNAMDYIRRCLEIAEDLEAPGFGGPAYAAVGKTRLCTPEEKARQWGLVTENLQTLGEEAGRRGVTISLEPLNRYETDMINTAEQAVDLVERVGSPNVKIHLDTYHMNIEEKHLPDAIRAAGTHIGHFHASANDRGTVGADHIDWPAVRDALADAGYTGPVVVEAFTPGVKEIAAACAIWRPLARSQDDLARDSLAYVRQVFATVPATR